MKKLVLSLVFAGIMSLPAFAVDGVVKEYNKQTRVVTLEDGTTFTIPEAVVIPPELKVGAKVDVQTNKNTKVTNVLINP